MSTQDDASHVTWPRRIRSFVKRDARLTRGQLNAFDRYWSHYALDPVDLAQFPTRQPVIVEIGFGNGESLHQTAHQYPTLNFLGIEVHRPGVGHLLVQLGAEPLDNVRLLQQDAIEVLQQFDDHTLQALHLYFPDPWHKKKHHKRRIVNAAFLELIAAKIKPQGVFHFATDWQPYAQAVEELVTLPWQRLDPAAIDAYRQAYRPTTKFERRGLKLGHQVTDLVYQRR